MSESLLIALVVTVTVIGVPLAWRRRAVGRSPVEQWARGACGLLSGGQDLGELGREEARGLLEAPWGINGPRQLESTMDRLEAGDSDELAWDLVRVVILARLGAAAGYLEPDASWDRVRRAAGRLQAHYADWESLGRAYARGRSAWLHARGIDEPSNHGLVERNMQLLARRVWPRVGYGEPLG